MKRATKVSLGLFATWAISDIEELLTTSRNSRDVLGKLPKAVPVPGVLRRDGISQRHVVTGVAMMGLVMGTATAPTMVIPFWLWARRELANEGITGVDRTTVAIAMAGASCWSASTR